MINIQRNITTEILDALTVSPVVLLNGASQTGKSTLVQHSPCFRFCRTKGIKEFGRGKIHSGYCDVHRKQYRAFWGKFVCGADEWGVGSGG